MTALRPGTNWSVVTPRLLRPKAVAKALAEVERLRELETTERQALVAATTAVERMEAEDVAALAASFRSGSNATPQTDAVESARVDLREHERRLAAALQAVSDAEAELGDQLVRSRSEWQAAAAKDAEKVEAGARDQLDAFRASLERLSALRGLDQWLGRDRFGDRTAVRERGLLTAPSSARSMANGDPVDGQRLLSWCAELVDPPSRPEPVEHRPLTGSPVTVT